MKYFLLQSTIMLLLVSIQAMGQHIENPMEGMTFYLVRHAEKDTGKNPVLTVAGFKRAGDLYRVLKDSGISRIFVSQYLRTQLTGDSMRLYNRIDSIHYKVDANADDLFSKIAMQPGKKDKVLVIGHNNTIPGIIRRLGISDFILEEIPINEYDNLYVVKVNADKAGFKKMKFGTQSLPDGKTSMKPLQ